MTDRAVRVRFAPSPTGYFHVGGARTALWNLIFARQNKGTFILRIEDTDAERNKPEWIEGIQTAMRWIGCVWDEGPYFQSANAGKHADAAQKLFDAGQAYYCDCTRDQLKERTGSEHLGYDGFCRERGLPAGEGRAMRFKVPRPGTTVVHDLVRGDPVFEHDQLEDFVILRGNGSPMFILANVVDDIEMGITHVLRAEEHLPNTPKAQLLWQALDAGELPVWAHVPLLVNEKRQKLSKRRDPVALEMYREQGFLPEAMVNYLMTLGWSPPGDQEIVPYGVFLEHFRLEDVNPSPAFFDVKKLTAFNAEYIRALDLDDFVERCAAFIGDWASTPEFTVMAPLVQTRVQRLDEVPAMVDFLFAEPQIEAGALKADDASFLDAIATAYESVDWNAEALKETLERIGNELGRKKAQVPVRVAVTGRKQGPPLYEPLELLGRDRVLARLRAARAAL
ncbi:MAG: glutamate--tRNA ligase [Acidimicrobiia bacterium]